MIDILKNLRFEYIDYQPYFPNLFFYKTIPCFQTLKGVSKQPSFQLIQEVLAADEEYFKDQISQIC